MAVTRRAMALALLTGACAPRWMGAGPAVAPPDMADGTFVMADGARLPYRAWWPEGAPRALMLALHGFNDSRNAWELPAPDFTARGIAIVAPDQRGFGAAPNRSLWAGTATMAADATAMARVLRERHPGPPLFIMGESMGGAVAMVAATTSDPPPVEGYVLLAPAVRGRASLTAIERGALWLGSRLLGPLGFYGSAPGIRATDNRAALEKLSRDPLTIRTTRLDTLAGLVDLMDAATEAAPHFAERALLLYGGQDAIVPGGPTARMLRTLPPGPRVAFYEDGFHLLFRDLGRERPISDTAAWLANPGRPLPSGADAAARTWLAKG